MSNYEWEVQGNYGQGWECVCTELTKSEAEQRLKEYDENETNYPHRIKKVAVDNETPEPPPTCDADCLWEPSAPTCNNDCLWCRL